MEIEEAFDLECEMYEEVPSRSVLAESPEEITEKMGKSLEKRKKLSTTRASADLGKHSESLSESQGPITSKTITISSGTVLIQSAQKVIEKMGGGLEKKMKYLTNSVSIPLGRHSGPVFPKRRSSESQATTKGKTNSRLQGSKINDPVEQAVVKTKDSVTKGTVCPASKVGVPVEKCTVSVPPSNTFESQPNAKWKNRKKCSEKTAEDPSSLLICCYVMFRNYTIYPKDLSRKMCSLANGLIEQTTEGDHAINGIEKVAERIKQTEELRVDQKSHNKDTIWIENFFLKEEDFDDYAVKSFGRRRNFRKGIRINSVYTGMDESKVNQQGPTFEKIAKEIQQQQKPASDETLLDSERSRKLYYPIRLLFLVESSGGVYYRCKICGEKGIPKALQIYHTGGHLQLAYSEL
ncbi:hypothetical protein ACTXT7_002169 [Hymenolepis weldensis]